MHIVERLERLGVSREEYLILKVRKNTYLYFTTCPICWAPGGGKSKIKSISATTPFLEWGWGEEILEILLLKGL